MPDTSPSYPPPPPAGIPPPVYQAPAGSPVPTYAPPPPSQPPVGYPPQAQYQAAWQQPQQSVSAGWGAVGVLSQFGGTAMWACIVGLVTIVVPFVLGRVFFFLPIIGVITGVRAIMSGKLIGGIVGIVLSAIGGLITIVALTQPG
jgi:hypothetical protein